MRRHRLLSGLRYLKGFSLIELMVALTIGLLISIAAFSAYLGAAGASRIADAQGRMNEDAQAALSILTQQLRMLGNNPSQAGRTDQYRHNPVYKPHASTTFVITSPLTFTPSFYSIRGCDGTFSNITTATSLDNLSYSKCATTISASPDSIAISYEADNFNTIPTTANLPTDCLGNKLTAIAATLPTTNGAGVITNSYANYAVADNRFYINSSASMVPSLYCKGNGGASTTQPLVENIEDLQFTYGTLATSTLAASAATAGVAGYLRADEVVSLSSTSATPDDAARWSKVISVRICVLVRSEAPVVSDSASARYLKCDGSVETSPPDLRLRRAYFATVLLRNRRL